MQPVRLVPPLGHRAHIAGMLWIGAALAALVGCHSGEPNTSSSETVPEGFAETGPSLLPPGGKTDGLADDVPAYAPLAAGATLQLELEALFAPDDPVNTVEVALIDQVIEARSLVAESFDEGDNPFTIRYAVYNLRNPIIVDRLIEAEAQGVDVQILIEADQLDPERTWNTADETLASAGFELVADRDTVDAEARRTIDVLGIADSGLMHLKARLFETPDMRVLLTGSLNPGDNAMLNEETLHLVRDARLFDAYSAAYEAVRDDTPLVNEWDPDAAVNVLFTPVGEGPRAVAHIFDWLAAEDEQILLMMYSLRDLSAPGHDSTLVELLGEKVDAGVPVYVITDRKQSDGIDAHGNRTWYDDDTEDRLRAAGVHVYEATNAATDFTAMHHKVAVLGRSQIRVISDAANWTKSGLGSDSRRARNVESVLFIDTARLDDGHTGRRYLAQWLRVLERYAWQTEGTGEPSFEAVRDRLMASETWPRQPVRFSYSVPTEWGEMAFVRGSLDALGQWGERHPGLGMATDDARYPIWEGTGELALGVEFEFKLVVSQPDGSSTRWESGSNRVGRAMPAALTPPDTDGVRGRTLFEGAFR